MRTVSSGVNRGFCAFTSFYVEQTFLDKVFLSMHLGLMPCEAAQRFLIGRLRNTFFGNDGCHILCWGNVEGRVLDLDAIGHHLLARDVSHLFTVALLDGNPAAIAALEID